MIARYMLGGKVVIEDERVFRFGEYRQTGPGEGHIGDEERRES